MTAAIAMTVLLALFVAYPFIERIRQARRIVKTAARMPQSPAQATLTRGGVDQSAADATAPPFTAAAGPSLLDDPFVTSTDRILEAIKQ